MKNNKKDWINIYKNYIKKLKEIAYLNRIFCKLKKYDS